MEKEENKTTIDNEDIKKNLGDDKNDKPENSNLDKNDEKKEKSPEEKIAELEDKLARTFAEMENQRRRFEKEKIDAFEYGGYTFAKEALNLVDNLERSKNILENDEKLKNTEALKKTFDHFDIIYKDVNYSGNTKRIYVKRSSIKTFFGWCCQKSDPKRRKNRRK